MSITLKLARELASDEKLTPQAKQMVQLIKDAMPAGIDRKTLVEQLTPIVKTRQPVERIIGFYAQTLGPKGTGLIYVEKAPKEAKEAKPKKVSKKAQAAAAAATATA